MIAADSVDGSTAIPLAIELASGAAPPCSELRRSPRTIRRRFRIFDRGGRRTALPRQPDLAGDVDCWSYELLSEPERVIPAAPGGVRRPFPAGAQARFNCEPEIAPADIVDGKSHLVAESSSLWAAGGNRRGPSVARHDAGLNGLENSAEAATPWLRTATCRAITSLFETCRRWI